MKRAVIQFFWGESHLKEALEANHHPSVAKLPRIAITDEATARMIGDHSCFSQIIQVSLSGSSLLNKASLFSFLPSIYDSFLFLDTDTRVLEDVSYGFEQAERHGIAAAMAPHYSLYHFWGFNDVMDAAGIACESQLQYNTGVIFFRRRDDVDSVMKKWTELASYYIGRDYNDQPFFTLAIELLNFNPYTLSPAYNYRALGEYASGMIRIWHSRAQVPIEVNHRIDSWPARRFFGNRRIG